jgi:FkbM family methyltransferase
MPSVGAKKAGAMETLMENTINYALNRPALQSSVCQWSRSRSLEEEARGANDGNLAVDYGCHTAEEDRPWWQVDLGQEIAIDRIAIHNRLTCAYRLRFFSLHASLDGKGWQRFHKRTDPRIFGERDDDILIVSPAVKVVARFVRLQLDYRETLHFRELEIFGHPPTPGDLRQRSLQDDLGPRTQALVAGRIGFIVQLGNQSIFVKEPGYGPRIAAALKQGRYEREERQLTEKSVEPPDRVIEIGTGLGIVTMIAADRTSPAQVLTFDGNPHIIEDARRNFTFNRMEGICARAGVLKNRKHLRPIEKSVKFTVVREFWASRVEVAAPNAGVVEVVDAPVFCLEDEIAAHRANVLIIDIEGGEIELLDRADLSCIRLIIMKTHYRAAGVQATDTMIRRLIQAGFNINLALSRWGVVVLRRELDPAGRPARLEPGAMRRAMAKITQAIAAPTARQV